MHRCIYEERPDVQAVLHSHPVFATAFAAAGRPVPDDYFVETALFLGSVPVAPFALPGTQELVQACLLYTSRCV